MAKKLVNSVEAAVAESLQGTVMANPCLAGLKGFKVVLRRDVENVEGKVAIISGGGAGHEPAHAGYVGRGMLTAAVSGEVFSSPPTSSVLAAIEAVWSLGKPSGILVVIKNYTGDRINFGRAIEKAKTKNINIDMVYVSDDTAMITGEKSVGPRGLAATVFVHKIAGAMAERQKSLTEIVAFLQQNVLPKLGTIGLSLGPCILPGQKKPSFAQGDDEVELGLGIHGESGIMKIKHTTSSDLVNIMIKNMFHQDAKTRMDARPGSNVALMINNLGGTSNLEMGIATRNVFQKLRELGYNVKRMYVGTFMTSLEMPGISISLLNLDIEENHLLGYLDMDTSAPYFPQTSSRSPEFVEFDLPSTQASEDSTPNFPKMSQLGQRILEETVRNVSGALESCKNMLDTLDSGSGDGDCGTTLNRGGQKMLELYQARKVTSVPEFFKILSQVADEEMGGSAGGLYAIFFSSAYVHLNGLPRADCNRPANIIDSLVRGMKAVMKYGGAQPGDRTMVDALAAALCTEWKEKPLDWLKVATSEAERGAASTKQMEEAKAGRASYVPGYMLKNPDPGAHAVGIIFRSVYQAALTVCQLNNYQE